MKVEESSKQGKEGEEDYLTGEEQALDRKLDALSASITVQDP